MKVETGYGETWLGNVPDRVRAAEEAGFDAITTGELKHNSVLSLTLAAEHTDSFQPFLPNGTMGEHLFVLIKIAWHDF